MYILCHPGPWGGIKERHALKWIKIYNVNDMLMCKWFYQQNVHNKDNFEMFWAENMLLSETLKSFIE